MKIPQHSVIIRVSSETDHIIKTNVVDQHGKKVEFIIPIIKDDSNALKYNRIYGEVIHVPDKVGDVEPYYLDYPGFPTPARYRDSSSFSPRGRACTSRSRIETPSRFARRIDSSSQTTRPSRGIDPGRRGGAKPDAMRSVTIVAKRA